MTRWMATLARWFAPAGQRGQWLDPRLPARETATPPRRGRRAPATRIRPAFGASYALRPTTVHAREAQP